MIGSALRLLATVAAALSLAGTAAAQDACRLRLVNVPRIEPSAGYDPFAAAPPPEYDRIEVQANRGLATCPFALGIGQGDSGARRAASGNGFISYQIYRDASLSLPASDASGPPSSLFISTASAQAANTAIEFYTVFPPNQLAPPGTYRDTLQFILYELVFGVPGRVLDVRSVPVRLRVLQAVRSSVMIGGGKVPLSGTAGTVDFGTLADGSTMTFELEVASNDAYDLKIESENRGRLKELQGSGYLDYGLNFDGRGLALGSSATLQFNGGGVVRHTLLVSVPNTAEAIAGRYEDNIYLTVTAR